MLEILNTRDFNCSTHFGQQEEIEEFYVMVRRKTARLVVVFTERLSPFARRKYPSSSWAPRHLLDASWPTTTRIGV